MRTLVTFLLLLTPLSAPAASLESLVMPGPLAQSHADLEDDCSSCHAPFSQRTQTALCVDCHDLIADDLEAARGFHGTRGRLLDSACRDCHTEHKGRNGDIVGLVEDSFDHELTGFSLQGKHQALSCQDCHKTDSTFRETQSECAGCHRADDIHSGNLGEECAACHDSTGWREARFDHMQQSGFALQGGHANLICTSCHAGQVFDRAETSCASCHALDDVHHGKRGNQCEDCHSTDTWEQSRFDHLAETGFALAGGHANLACESCHLASMSLEEPPADCAGCHSADDVHRGQRGDQCESCHGQQTWNVEFDHLVRTGFALKAAHQQLTCNQCHLGSLTAEVPTACSGCHADDDPHGGAITDCGSCHGLQKWDTSLRFDHEFSRFPLLGMHKVAACAQCHLTLEFHKTGARCLDCHSGDDVHRGSLGAACEECHAPTGWELWSFDHASRTDFRLTGAHQDLVCAACHEPGAADALNISSNCVSCHQSADPHRGAFGNRCDRCHTTASFEDESEFR